MLGNKLLKARFHVIENQVKLVEGSAELAILM
jgi:hypothetical protein